MGCYLSSFKKILFKNIYLLFFLKQYVELRSENMEVYAIDSFFFFLLIYFLERANQVISLKAIFFFICYFILFFLIDIYFYFVFII